jgi:hypothetical protein
MTDEPVNDNPSVAIAVAVYVEPVTPVDGDDGGGELGAMQFVPSSSCPVGHVNVEVAA